MSDRLVTLSGEHDEWLSHILEGEKTLPEFIAQEGEQAAEVADLLATAQEVHRLLVPAGPSHAYASASRARIMNRIRSKTSPRTRPRLRPALSGMFLRPAYALTALILLVALAFSGVGVASAAAESIPGDPLYGVKLNLEEVRFGLTWNEGGKVHLLSEFADERLGEAEKALALGRQADADAALSGYAETVDRQVGLLETYDLGEEGDVLEGVEAEMANHLEVLARVQAQVPASAQDAIQHAIERSSHGQAVLQMLEDQGKPSDLAPGQQGRPATATPEPDDEQQGHGKKDKTRTPGEPNQPTRKPTKTPGS